MILRLWSGYTTPENAAAYDDVLNSSVAPAIADRNLPGLAQFDVLTRLQSEESGEREFLTAMWFRDLDAVAEFTGGDPHVSVVPDRARAVLQRFDDHSRHYELRQRHVPR